MKTIEFEGKKYEVEDWVNWVARDSDGFIYGYENEPESGFSCWLGGRYVQIVDDFTNWQDSLTKV